MSYEDEGPAFDWEDEVEDEQDFLDGKTCNPDEPEECESCQ